jgi:hypothetical protein
MEWLSAFNATALGENGHAMADQLYVMLGRLLATSLFATLASTFLAIGITRQNVMAVLWAYALLISIRDAAYFFVWLAKEYGLAMLRFGWKSAKLGVFLVALFLATMFVFPWIGWLEAAPPS